MQSTKGKKYRKLLCQMEHPIQESNDKTNFQKLIFTHEIPLGSPEPKL